MKKLQYLSFLAILFSVAACAPINYEATYRPPAGHVSAYKSSQTYTSPIQVTLYSDSTYLGANFEPIQIYISDGQYVEIPVKNRRGRSSRFFAHYHQGNLHFDSNRKCQRIQGSTGYQYDRRWDNGYKYAYVNAGHNYDFTGLRLVIRNAPKANSRPRLALATKTPTIHKKTVIINKVQSVRHDNGSSNNKKVVVHNQLKKVKSKVIVATKPSHPTKQPSSDKYVSVRAKTRVIDAGKPKKPIVPDIVREVSRHNKAGSKEATVRRNGLEQKNMPASKRSVAAQDNYSASATKRQQSNSQRKSVNMAPNVNKAMKDKSMEGAKPVSEKAKEAQPAGKKITRAQGQKQLIGKPTERQRVPEVFVVDHPQGKVKRAKVKKDR